jgi:hypothetical protein
LAQSVIISSVVLPAIAFAKERTNARAYTATNEADEEPLK